MIYFRIMIQIHRPILAVLFAFLSLSVYAQDNPVSSSSPDIAKGDRPRVALVLAGGGAKGIAHLGVIKVLEEYGINPDLVVGTSMGAIAGGLYSMGYSPAEMETIVLEANWAYLFSEDSGVTDEPFYAKVERSRYLGSLKFDSKGFYLAGGLLTGRRILHFLDILSLGFSSSSDFDSLPRRFRAVSADIATGRRIVHRDGSISDAIRGSMSIPGVFSPFELNDAYLVDGGIVENLPIEVARSLGANLVLAVNLVDLSEFDPSSVTRSPMGALSKSLDMLVNNNVEPELVHADLVLTVDTQGYGSSDFTKSAELIALGERIARANSEALKEFSEKARRTGVAPAGRLSVPTISSVQVTGGSAKDRAFAAGLYEPLVGTAPTRETLQELYRSLERTGRYESVRLSLEDTESGHELLVRLRNKIVSSHSLRLSLLNSATYGRYLTNSLTLSPGLALKNLPFPGTRVSIDAELLDSPGAEAAVTQPFLGIFSAGTYFKTHWDFETWQANASRSYGERVSFWTAGIRLDLEPMTGTDLFLNWGFESIDEESFSESIEGNPVDRVSSLQVGISVKKTDSAIFPASGLSGDIAYLASLSQLGSDRSFSTFKASGGFFIPLGKSLSLGIRGIGGTDFSSNLNDIPEAPPSHMPSLTNRDLFPGLLTAYERIGNHVIGGGISFQYKVNADAFSRNYPLCLLLQISTGTVFIDKVDFSGADLRGHITCSAGAGIRASDSFALEIRGGVCRNTVDEYLPFVALDLGCIGY